MTQGQDYRSVRAVSNSLMTVYEEEYGAFVAHWIYGKPLANKSTGSLTIGSLIDTLLTRPEDYNNMFTSYSGITPTGQMDLFCRYMAQGLSPKDAREAAEVKRDSLDKMLERYESFVDYKLFIEESISKKLHVVHKDDDAKAKKIVGEMKLSKYTKDIVNIQTASGIDVFHQLELFNTIRPFDFEPHKSAVGYKVAVKGALDKVIVNHNSKIIYPVDYKSSFNSDGFIKSYENYRYYRQGSFYTYLLKLWAIEKGWGDYSVASFAFVVCSTSGGRHYVYKMTDNDIHLAEHGGELIDGTQVKGWRNILHEIAYLDNLNSWEYKYDVVINSGIVPLGIFKKEN